MLANPENADFVSNQVPSEAFAESLKIDLPRLCGRIPCNSFAMKIDAAGTRLTCHFIHAPNEVSEILGLELPPYCSEIELLVSPSQPVYVNTKCFDLATDIQAPCVVEIQQKWVLVEADGRRKLVSAEVNG